MTIINNFYEGEPLVELTIVVPQTVYNWLAARADAETDNDLDRHEMAEVVAAAEVTGSMEYFLQIAEADALLEQDLIERGVLTLGNAEAA